MIADLRRQLVAQTWALARTAGLPAPRRARVRQLVPRLALLTDGELAVHGPRLAWELDTVLRGLPVAGRA